MAIAEFGIRGTDIMPSSEAQREASELKVKLGPQQFVRVGDEKNSVFIRRTTGPKVFGKEVHNGVEVVTGILRLRGEKSYQVEVGNAGIVEIKGGEQSGQERDFIISKPKGVPVKTNGTVVFEGVE